MNPIPDRSLEEPEERGETAVCENCDRRVPVDEIRTVRSWCGETSQCEECRGGLGAAPLAPRVAEAICAKGHVTNTPLDEGCHYPTGGAERMEGGTIQLGCGERVHRPRTTFEWAEEAWRISLRGYHAHDYGGACNELMDLFRAFEADVRALAARSPAL